jgi:hypothetical protein
MIKRMIKAPIAAGGVRVRGRAVRWLARFPAWKRGRDGGRRTSRRSGWRPARPRGRGRTPTAPEGCANSDVPVACWFVSDGSSVRCGRIDPPEAVAAAIEARVPRGVPLGAGARAAGPWRRCQGAGDPGAPSPADRAARQTPRPRFEPADRAVLAAISRVVPRARWSSLLVRRETLLGWHRRLVTGAWTALLHWAITPSGCLHSASEPGQILATIEQFESFLAPPDA